jgi:hypothetical protein
MSDVLAAIPKCRAIVRDFIAGHLDYGEFRKRVVAATGSFDPLDWAVEGLTSDQESEVALYVDWLGGEFGEAEHLNPRRADWVYGESDEPYGWVDQEEYRRRLEHAFKDILDREA